MSKPILVIDNYDSFTYNLVHLLQELNRSYVVVRNDKFELADVDQYDKIYYRRGPVFRKKPDCCWMLSVPMP